MEGPYYNEEEGNQEVNIGGREKPRSEYKRKRETKKWMLVTPTGSSKGYGSYIEPMHAFISRKLAKINKFHIVWFFL
jgi:hypothetical protein